MRSEAVVISDAAINRMMADPDIAELRDQRMPIELHIWKSRQKATWYLVQYKKRVKTRQRLGYWPLLKTKDVRGMVPDVLKKLGAGTEVQSSHFVTAGQLLRWYLERGTKQADKGKYRRKTDKSAVTRHILPAIGNVKIVDLDKRLIDEKLMLPMQSSGLMPSSIRQYYSSLKGAFSNASKLGLIAVNPMAGMRFRDHIQKRIEPKPGRLLVSDAAKAQYLVSELSQPVKGLLMFMLLFATRIGETRQLRWEHVDFNAKQITIPAELTKTRYPHILPITDEAMLMLNKLRQTYSGVYLFGHTCCPSDSDADKMIRVVSKGKFSAHDLRKFARSSWATIGIDYWVCERLLNHKQKGLDAVYIKADALEVKRAALTQYHQWLKQQFLCRQYAGIENKPDAA